MIGRCYNISCSTALYALLGLGPAECRAHYNIDFYGGGAINACECGGCLVPLFCINTAAGCIAVRVQVQCRCCILYYRARETHYIHIEPHGRAPHGITAPDSESAFTAQC